MALYLKDFDLGYLIQGGNNVCRLCFKKEVDGEFASVHDIHVIETEFYRDTTSYIEIIQNITNMTIDTEELSDKICHNCCQQLFQYYHFRLNCRMQELKLYDMVEKLNKPEAEKVRIESENSAFNNVIYLVAYEEAEPVEEVVEKYKKERKKNIVIGSCTLCGKKFKTKNSLKMHRFICKNRDKTIIQPNIRFTCSMCNANFCSEGRLKKHKDNVHSESNHPCEKCGRLFKTMLHLNNHLATHSEQRNYKCNYCNNLFRSSNALVYHERLHTGERPYQCSHCDLKFLSASRRKTHFYIKHCEKNAACDKCPSKFHTNSELTQHKKRVHLKKLKNEVADTASDLVYVKDSEKTSACDLCASIFQTYSELIQHKKEVHFINLETKILDTSNELLFVKPMEPFEYDINQDKDDGQIYIVAKRMKIVKS